MFSKTAEYALRATIYIAQKGHADHKLGIEEISRAIDSPTSFTAKILQLLTRNQRIISSTRGPSGGFYMKDAARGLSIRTILETIGEEEIFTGCVMGLKLCSETHPCPMHTRYKPIKEQLIKLFETMTIQQLVRNIEAGEASIGNRKKSVSKALGLKK